MRYIISLSSDSSPFSRNLCIMPHTGARPAFSAERTERRGIKICSAAWKGPLPLVRQSNAFSFFYHSANVEIKKTGDGNETLFLVYFIIQLSFVIVPHYFTDTYRLASSSFFFTFIFSSRFCLVFFPTFFAFNVL